MVTFETNDNYSIPTIRFEISNNSSTIRFHSIRNEKNTIRTALITDVPTETTGLRRCGVNCKRADKQCTENDADYHECPDAHLANKHTMYMDMVDRRDD